MGCGTLHQDCFDDTGDPADLERALALGREGLATGPSTGSERACHLVNLGTCWDQRYAEFGHRADMDRALACWREALLVLPVGSPYRAAFTDRLVLGLLRRREREDDKDDVDDVDDVDEAVRLGRDAVTAGSQSPDAPVFANHLMDALAQRWTSRRDRADLDEAVELLRDAVRRSRTAAARTPDLVANLAQLSAVRYEVVGDPADLDAALADIVEPPARELGGGQRAAVAPGRRPARAL